jgi:(p)ppGpp synthase/HD superfamily hydrolase
MHAAEFAADAHAGQERLVDGAPFVLHPFEVALLLHVSGYRDEPVAAGLLHDVVEKTAVSLDEVRDAFGDEIADMVEAVTEDPDIADYDERKADLRARTEASGDDAVLAVFAADKVSKARELRVAAAADRLSAEEVVCRRAHYRGCLELLDRSLPDHPLTDALRLELEMQVLVPALSWLRHAAHAHAG